VQVGLNQLEKEGLIKVKGVEKRSKNIYEITSEGKEMLSESKKHKTQMKKILKNSEY